MNTKRLGLLTLPLAGIFLILASCGNKDAPVASASPSSSPAWDSRVLDGLSKYKEYVTSQSDKLIAATRNFVDLLDKGQLEAAKKVYGSTRSFYESIEPVAESFGDLDPRIDGREGDADQFSGFHRLEKALWVGPYDAEAKNYSQTLVADVGLLRAKIDTADIEPALFVTGSVELLNEVSTTKMQGEEERYSHTDLDDIQANVEGSKVIYDLLAPILQERAPDFKSGIDADFSAVFDTLSSFRGASGYPALSTIDAATLKAFSAKIDSLAAALSQSPEYLKTK